MAELVGISKTATQATSNSGLGEQIISLLPMLFVFIIIIIALVIFVRWYFDKKEREKDIYTEDYKKTIEQCKVNRNNKWLRSVMGLPMALISKGVPVYINHPPLTHSRTEYAGIEADDKTLSVHAGESYMLGSYAGHCYTTDGCFTILIKSSKNKVMGIFPKLLVIKLREKHRQKIIDSEDKTKTQIIDIPPDSFSRSSEMIMINALGIERINKYYYAVNRTQDGYVVDNKQYAYEDNIQIATQKQVQDIGRNLARLAGELASGNPLVQFLKKSDTTLGNE